MTQRLRQFAALAFAVLATGCNDVPAPQTYAIVFGRVYDASTNAGIAGVRITADTVLVAVTAADGTYAIAPVPSGQADVVIAPPQGYAEPVQPTAFSVSKGDRVRVDVPLTHD